MKLLLFLALLLSLDACQSPSRFRSSAQPVGPVNTEAARVGGSTPNYLNLSEPPPGLLEGVVEHGGLEAGGRALQGGNRRDADDLRLQT